MQWSGTCCCFFMAPHLASLPSTSTKHLNHSALASSLRLQPLPDVLRLLLLIIASIQHSPLECKFLCLQDLSLGESGNQLCLVTYYA